MGISVGQRAAIKRAINRFERAVDEYAFLGTIPVDSDDAIAAREAIELEYHRSRFLLDCIIDRYTS
jgi:hypothetical protein